MENYKLTTSSSDVSLSVGKTPAIPVNTNEFTRPEDRLPNVPPGWGWYSEKTWTESVPQPQSKPAKPYRQKETVKKEKPKKQKKVEPIELYTYLKEIYEDVSPYDKEHLQVLVRAGLKESQTQVTTLLLYSADPRGLNNPIVLTDALDVILNSNTVGFTFRQTLIKGLAWRHLWKLIFSILERKIDSKTRSYIFSLVRSSLNRGNAVDFREMPRQGTAVNRVRGFLHKTPAEWRRLLVDGSGNSIQYSMSSNNWNLIDYAKLPVFYISKWYKGFMRHDRLRFIRFLQANRGIAKTSYRIKHHFKKRPFLSIEDVIQTYFVPMTSSKERKPTNGRRVSQRPREFKRGRVS